MTNGEVAWSFFDLLSQGRTEEALAVMDDEGTFWENMTRDCVPMTKHKPAVRGAVEIVPMTFELISSMEVDDRVVLEVESNAPLADGGIYNNLYCFLMVIRNGKILHVREYLDTHHVRTLSKDFRKLFARRVETAAESVDESAKNSD
jgi:ketosteroid isomerase-like protein